MMNALKFIAACVVFTWTTSIFGQKISVTDDAGIAITQSQAIRTCDGVQGFDAQTALTPTINREEPHHDCTTSHYY